MKKIILLLFIGLFMNSCQTETPKNNLHLTGNIKGLKAGKIYVQRIVDTNLVAIDTVIIDGDSKFETNILLQSPEMLYLFLDRGVTNSLDNNLLFFAEAGSIHIETDLDLYNANAKVTGSRNHQKYEEFKKINSRFRDTNLDLIQQKFMAIKSNNQQKVDSLNLVQENNMRRKYLFTTNFAINNGEYELAPYVALTEIYDINLKYLDTIQKRMSPKVAESLYGKKLTNYITTLKKQK